MIKRLLGFFRRHLPETAVLTAVCVLCAPFLFGGQVIYWGLPLLQFYPWHWLAREAVFAGHLPLWNPHLGMGAPLLANAQSALLYPPNGLMLIAPIEQAQGWLVAAHLVLAGWGMARLSRALGMNEFGQTVSALAYALCGYLVARGWFLTINAAVAWLPWIVWAGEDLARRAGRAAVPKLALLLALQWLAGHWQTSWYTALFLAGWVTVRAWSGRAEWRALPAAWAKLLLAALLALGLSAAQVLPSFEYWRASQRAAGVDPATAYDYSFWPWRLIGFLAPNFFGNPVRGDFWGYANFWEDAVYIGLLPFLLAGYALYRWLRRAALHALPYGYLAAVIFAASVIAMGTWTPVFPFLAQWVPTFDFFQAPARMMLLAVFPLSLLGGSGAESWRTASGSRSATLRSAVACLALVAAGILGPAIARVPASFGWSVAAMGCLGLLVCALNFPWTRPRFQRSGDLWQGAAALVIAVDLIAAGWGLIPSAAPAVYRSDGNAVSALAGILGGRRLYMPEPVRYARMYGRFFRFDVFRGDANPAEVRANFLPNLALVDRIDSANNFDPFVPARYAELMARVDALSEADQLRMMALMNVGALVSNAGAYLPVRDTPGRAWGVCRAEWITAPEEALDRVLQPGFDPRSTVVLETGAGAEGGPCPGAMPLDLATDGDPNRVRIGTRFESDGFLVLADVNFPGWLASLDGEPVPLLQADYAFRAVRVPAGVHTVEFTYTPVSFWAGVILSASSTLILLVAMAWLTLAERMKPVGPGRAAQDKGARS